METVEIIAGCWEILFLFYLLIVGRLSYIISPVLYTYYLDEKIEWNEKINPVKLKIYLILFLLASSLIWFSYQSFIVPKPLFDIWITFIVDSVALAGIYFFIENKIRTPSKTYFKFEYVMYTDENVERNMFLEKKDKCQAKFNLKKSTLHEKDSLDLNELQILDLDVFQDSLNFRKEGNKIILLKIGGKKKMKDRRFLLSILDKEFENKFSQIEINDLKRIREVVLFINKHVLFRCEKYPHENDYNEKNFKDWLKIEK